MSFSSLGLCRFSNEDLDAIQTRVLEMDESDMQYEVERQFPYSPQAGLFFSMTHEERIDSDRRSIYVGNVDYGATADELEMYFNGCGHVNRVTIPYNRFTGHPKGFAYIEFSERESVRTAMTLDETLFRGRVIKEETISFQALCALGIAKKNKHSRFQDYRYELAWRLVPRTGFPCLEILQPIQRLPLH
ncbi:Polyadenylate-binding protein 2-B [Anabarilius grahami]|uniref:Polyadenylate-binding protein 2-B n=1 Tax=Anabarilius grahami TaxID=495550 RepID=A0A3N0YJC5_ANAGA|nr:Polyadenylate-binding protein 2-B [Anabarilius grahami]